MSFSSICCSHIGFLSNISFTIPFQWNVLSAISLSKIFSWGVGEGPLYWYVVESVAISNTNCDGVGCPTSACLSLDSHSCGLTKCPLPNTTNDDNACIYELSKEGKTWTLTIDKGTGEWTLEISLSNQLAARYRGQGDTTPGTSIELTLIDNYHVCGSLPRTAKASLTNGLGYTQLDTVMATSVAHLCERLREQQYSRKIKKVKKWTKPALECDVKRDQQRGIDHCCNNLVDVDLCECECAGFMQSAPSTCSVTGVANRTLVWYTEYLNLSQPLVKADDTVIRGQLLGYIAKPTGSPPNLHWGVGDGQPGGNIGQTIDIDDVFNWQATGERPAVSPPFGSAFSDSEICYIKSTLTSPVNRDCCLWEQNFESVAHSDYEYYAQDLDCTPPDDDLGMPVYLASGGCDIKSVVTDVLSVGGAWIVIVKHTKQGSSSETSFAFGMAQAFREIRACDSSQNKTLQVVSDGFAARPIEILHPVATPVKVRGYNRPLPAVLKFSHNLKELPSCKMIAAKVPEQVALNYSAITKAWQYSQHFSINGAQWSVMVTLSNPDEIWTLQMTIGRMTNGKNSLSKFRVGLQRVPIDGFAIRTSYDSGSVTSNCIVERKSINDDLKLFGSGPLVLRVGEK